MALAIAALNAVLPPLLAALRLPFTVALGFVLVLVLNAVVLKVGSDLVDGTYVVDSFGWALLAALVVAAVSVVLEVIFGTNDDDTYTLKVIQRIARRQGGAERTDRPGIIFLEIDGLALPVLRRAMRDGNAPTMARWLAEKTHHLAEWETDLSSQTGASQAGILLGSNDNISAFRWVEKETGTLMTCSAPADCARIERERATGNGLLVNGGASRGNLLSGEADEQILTVSRIEAEKKANPGYRAFFANSLQRHSRARPLRLGSDPRVGRRPARDAPGRATARSPRRPLPVHARRDVRRRARPDRLRRPHRHDARPPRRLRDLLELRRGRAPLRAGAGGHARGAAQARPAVRPHRPGSPLRRRGPTRSSCSPTTARPRAPPSSSGTATGSTNSSSSRSRPARSRSSPAETSRTRWSATRSARQPAGDKPKKRSKNGRLGRGGGRARLRQPRARLPDGGAPPAHARGDRGVASATYSRRSGSTRTWAGSSSGPAITAPSRSARTARTTWRTGVWRAWTRSRLLADRAAHLLRTDGFKDVADIMVGSFYDPELDEGCAFEELICFHGGLGGPQTRPFILHPASFDAGRAARRRRASASTPRRLASAAPRGDHIERRQPDRC